MCLICGQFGIHKETFFYFYGSKTNGASLATKWECAWRWALV